MKTVKTQSKQCGFFGIAFALGLSAIFGTTSAVIIKHEDDGKQEQVAVQQQTETPQPQASTLPVKSVTAGVGQ